MDRLFILGLIVITLSGCTVTAHHSEATTASAQPIGQSTPATEAGALAPTKSRPTSTTDTAVDFSTDRAAFATAWQQAHQEGVEATALLYFGPNTTDETMPYALWSFPLGTNEQPQRIAEIKRSPFGTPRGELSPDEQWVAYIIGDQPTPGFELHLLRTDGSSDQAVFIIGPHDECFPQFVWLSESSTLIYRVGSGGFRYHHPQTATEQEFARFDGAKILGAGNQDQLFVSVTRIPEQSRDIVAIDPTTGAQTVLTSMSRSARDPLFCRRVSPDGSQMLFSTGQSPYQTYLFDRTTYQIHETEIVPDRAFWAMDSRHVLTIDSRMTMWSLPDMSEVATAPLSPPASGLGAWSLKGTSPDGQWLVGCFVNRADQQSWLYHLPTQSWQLLVASNNCVTVAGWTTQ
jgi:hypothetical protein